MTCCNAFEQNRNIIEIIAPYLCFLNLDDLPKKRPSQIYKPSDPETLAYLDFSVSTTGMLAGVKVCTQPHNVTTLHNFGCFLP